MGITQVMIVLQSQFNIIKEKNTQTQLNVSPGYDRLDQSLNDMASSSYTPRFVAIIPHGILDLYSSFCCHNTSNMASSRYTPRCVAIIPQTWPPRVILLVLWPPYLKHGLYELYLFKIEHKNILKQKAK